MRESKVNRCKQKGIAILAGGVLLFSIFTVQAAETRPSAKSAAWMGAGGAVLLQHTGKLSALGLQAFSSRASADLWTDVPENAGDWQAVAMDGNRILFFYKPGSKLAVCTLDESGAPAEWLPIDGSIRKFTPVALEGNSILIQRGNCGALKKIEFDDTGHIISKKRLWKNSRGWAVRGIDANRIILEHEETGDVAIWAANPKGPLFRPYPSFILASGWTVRDFAEDFVLIQQGETGEVTLVELGDGYQAEKYTELVSVNEGWRAVALAQ